MLKIDPNERIVTTDALKHPYVSTYQDSSDEPVCEKKIDWSLLDSELPTSEWKSAMYVPLILKYWTTLTTSRYSEILNYHNGSCEWQGNQPRTNGKVEDVLAREMDGTY